MQTFNQNIYEVTIVNWIPDIDKDDLKYLCNESANLYKALKTHHVSNYRIAKVNTDQSIPKTYLEACGTGLGATIDTQHTNPKTKNSFIIGFNYGH